MTYKQMIQRDYTDHLTGRNATPGTVDLTYGSGKALNDNSKGEFTGDGNGTIDYSRGVIRARPSVAPAPANNNYNVSFDQWNGYTRLSDTINKDEDEITHTLPSAPLRPGSVRLNCDMTRFKSESTPNTNKDGNIWTHPSITYRRIKYILPVSAIDDGDGNLIRNDVVVGSVNYATGQITFDLRVDFDCIVQGRQIAYVGWDPEAETLTEAYDSNIVVTYELTANPVVSTSVVVSTDKLLIALLPVNSRRIIPNSVMFTFAGKRYFDQNGSIITDWNVATGAGVTVGSIDYDGGLVTSNTWPAGADLTAPITLDSCLIWRGERATLQSIFRTAGAPLRQGSFIINAQTLDLEDIIAFAATDGSITHDNIVSGYIDTETGIVHIEWDVPVFPSTVKYSAVAYKYLPLDPELLGLDPTRLPSDGRVPVFLPGDVGVFSHTIETTVASPVAGETVTFTRDHQAEVWVKGANGLTLDSAQYSVNRITGVLTWADPLTLEDADEDEVTTPLVVFDRVEDMVLITDVQVSGQIGFNSQLSQHYPLGEATLSSAVLHGDLRARVYNVFHQSSWTSVWSDVRIGSDTTAKYNDVAYPLEITNQGSIQERWLIRFTSVSAFEIVGETVGVIGTGATSVDVAISNPATGAPYFTIRKEGWGSGWNAGNSMRFNTHGAQSPFWVARTILSGPATEEEDSFATQNRGDAD